MHYMSVQSRTDRLFPFAILLVLCLVFLVLLTACDRAGEETSAPTPNPNQIAMSEQALTQKVATPMPAGTPSPTSPIQPTISPESTEAVEEWTYVALGDSEATCCGIHTYPEYFAEFIEQDLNVKVNLINLGVGGMSSAELLSSLGTKDFQDRISEAQVVTFVITANDLQACLIFAMEAQVMECAENNLVTAGENFTAIIEEILTLTSTESTIIRSQTYDNPLVNMWKEQGLFNGLKPLFDRMNQQIIDIATQYGIPVADVYHDLNGPNGNQDPGEKGYISSDGSHNNDAGSHRIAELIRELGYEPLAP